MSALSVRVAAVSVPISLAVVVLVAAADEAMIESTFGVHPILLMVLAAFAVFPLVAAAAVIWESAWGDE